MHRTSAYLTLTLLLGTLAACGKPLETKEELAEAMAGALFPTTAAKDAKSGSMGLHASGIDAPKELPVPKLVVEGPNGGKATLSANPVGLALGLAGAGILFDMEYARFSTDGLHTLEGDVSVLANFEYVPVQAEPAEVNFEVGLVGSVGISGIVSDEVEMNLRLKTNLAELTERNDEMVLRLKGWVQAQEQRFEFADEDIVINWRELEERAQQR